MGKTRKVGFIFPQNIGDPLQYAELARVAVKGRGTMGGPTNNGSLYQTLLFPEDSPPKDIIEALSETFKNALITELQDSEALKRDPLQSDVIFQINIPQ